MDGTFLARGFAGGLIAMMFAAGAYAHHGWSWAEADQIELKGTIREIWLIELGNPGRTEQSGFAEGVAKIGDPIVALGNRSLDPTEKRMKAVRITVSGKVYDIYPERIRTN
jgi:hypothetical protein